MFWALVVVLLCCPCANAGDKLPAPAVNVYNKAAILYQKGKWEAAKEHLHQYLAEYSETPLYITCLYYLAHCYQQLGNAQQALVIYNKVINEAYGEDAFWGQMAHKRLEELKPQGS